MSMYIFHSCIYINHRLFFFNRLYIWWCLPKMEYIICNNTKRFGRQGIITSGNFISSVYQGLLKLKLYINCSHVHVFALILLKCPFLLTFQITCKLYIMTSTVLSETGVFSSGTLQGRSCSVRADNE